VELVQLKVAVIVTAGPLPVRAAMQATSTIPIVFAALGDAVATGAVGNLARPDRNATGFSFLNTEIGSKRTELLHEMCPNSRRVAVLFDRNSPRLSLETATNSARALALEAHVFDVAGPDEFEGAFAAAVAAQVQAINVLASPFFAANRVQLIELAIRHRLPAMYESAEYVRDGGLISYGPSFLDLFRRAAVYVDKILKGAKPSDLPVQQPTKFDLVINMKTAKTLGITVPPSLLARADEVIE
jgi:putative ABC transport system substrate-binding protein